MTLRIGILIAIDVLFVAGLVVLVLYGGGQHNLGIVACIGLIGYVSYSIIQLRAKAKEPKADPDSPSPVDE
jgi:hypothetical protein